MGLAAYLQNEFEARRRQNPGYSLRAYARDLNCDHASLSQILRGKRPLAAGAAEQFCNVLLLTGEDRQLAKEYEPLDYLILATLSGMKTPSVRSIAEKLRMEIDAVNVSLARLMRLGVLILEDDEWNVRREMLTRRPFRFPIGK